MVPTWYAGERRAQEHGRFGCGGILPVLLAEKADRRKIVALDAGTPFGGVHARGDAGRVVCALDHRGEQVKLDGGAQRLRFLERVLWFERIVRE